MFDASYAFLVTAAPIPEEIKRLCRRRISIIHSIDDHTYEFLAIEWVDQNPFEKEYFWN